MSDAEQKVLDAVNRLRALGEMLGVYRNGLLENGFTREEAIDLCKDYVRMSLDKPKA